MKPGVFMGFWRILSNYEDGIIQMLRYIYLISKGGGRKLDEYRMGTGVSTPSCHAVIQVIGQLGRIRLVQSAQFSDNFSPLLIDLTCQFSHIFPAIFPTCLRSFFDPPRKAFPSLERRLRAEVEELWDGQGFSVNRQLLESMHQTRAFLQEVWRTEGGSRGGGFLC